MRKAYIVLWKVIPQITASGFCPPEHATTPCPHWLKAIIANPLYKIKKNVSEENLLNQLQLDIEKFQHGW